MTFIAALPLLIFTLVVYKAALLIFKLSEWLGLKYINNRNVDHSVICIPVDVIGVTFWGCSMFSGVVYAWWYIGEYIIDPLSFPRVVIGLFFI